MEKINQVETYNIVITLTEAERNQLPNLDTNEEDFKTSILQDRLIELAKQNIGIDINIEGIEEVELIINSKKNVLRGFLPESIEILGVLESNMTSEGIYYFKLIRETEKVEITLPIDVKIERIGKKELKDIIIFVKK